MEIEDIINNVRFANSEHERLRSQSLCESTDTSTVSVTSSTPESIPESMYSCLERLGSDESVIHESDTPRPALPVRQEQHRVNEALQDQTTCHLQRQRSSATSDTCRSRHLPNQTPRHQPWQSEPVPHGHAIQPVYHPEYMLVPINMWPANRIVPHPNTLHVPQGQLSLPQQPRQSFTNEHHPPTPAPRGARLPPLPDSLRRSYPTSKSRAAPRKEKRKRIRSAPVVHEYDHLSVEEAVQELARRNIHVQDSQQIDSGKTELVRLLQRADRNNNRGASRTSEPGRVGSP